MDTTAQPKAVEHPTDARLCRKVHAALLRIARADGIVLRQSYRKPMERAFRKHGGHSKAKQYGRAKRVLRSLKTMAGRVMRDVERKMSDAAFEVHKGTLILAQQILTQTGHNLRKILAGARFGLYRFLLGGLEITLRVGPGWPQSLQAA